MIRHSPLLKEFEGIASHGFFEKETSEGRSLSASYTDSESQDEVTERRDEMMRAMAGTSVPLVTLKQVHGDKIVTVEEPWEVGQAPQADGLVTKEKNLALGILTADCGPLLLIDPSAQVIGACHAGWKGVQAGVIEQTIRAMERLGTQKSNIHAALGPAIQQQSYEVGPEFPDLMLGYNLSYSDYFVPALKENHHFFNLPAYIRKLIDMEGVSQFDDLQLNTFSENYHSRRRSIFEENHYGKRCNLSAIALV